MTLFNETYELVTPTPDELDARALAARLKEAERQRDLYKALWAAAEKTLKAIVAALEAE